jgi:two-component system, NtrC family, sensor kinase
LKRILKILFCLLAIEKVEGQQDIVNKLLESSVITGQPKTRIDSLHQLLSNASSDSMKIVVNRAIATYYEEANRDSALYYFKEFYLLAKKHDYRQTVIKGLFEMSIQLDEKSDYGQSYQYLLEAKEMAEDPRNEKKEYNFYQFLPDSTYNVPANLRIFNLALVNCGFAYLYRSIGDLNKMMFYAREAIRILENFTVHEYYRTMYLAINCNVLGEGYYALRRRDSALYFFNKAIEYYTAVGEKKYLSQPLKNIGDVYCSSNNKTAAIEYYHSSVRASMESKEGSNNEIIGSAYQSLSRIFNESNRLDSGIHFINLSLDAYKNVGSIWGIKDSYQTLSQIYSKLNRKDSVNKYLLLAKKDSLYEDKIKRLQTYLKLSFNNQLLLQEQQKEKIETQARVRTYTLLAGLFVFLVIGLILFRNNQQKQKANKVLQTALSNLKSAQAQLIQSEKMASLGELTAGIAHEIQNPLNFVNNFSEVSNELSEEMNVELDRGNIEEAKSIAAAIKKNLEKINYHGKRADAIVKGMLQHSRTSTGLKEPTDINKLVDEYLRLAFHGFRAREKEFNPKLETDFDKSIGKVLVVPQDIGRVLLNLFNNGFYALNEKTKQIRDSFQPALIVSTKRIDNRMEIRVNDNGNGIPKNIVDKIFQPFFTTKPTGQGTGLGLSLSYDIVKAHGGEIKVKTKEGEFTELVIELPISE